MARGCLWGTRGLLLKLAVEALTAAAATVISRQNRMGWIAGVLIFIASIPDHFYPGYVWDDYPAWYHYTYLLSILPFALLGSRLTLLLRRNAERPPAATQ